MVEHRAILWCLKDSERSKVAIHAEAEAKATALELVQNEEHDSNG